MKKKITVAIVGLGARGMHYARCCKEFADEVEIVAVADKIPERVEEIADEFSIPKTGCYGSGEELLRKDKLADVMFICTQDREHVAPALQAMKKGYHLLLEKPISPFAEEWGELVKTAGETNRHVVVCHVLRYTPFYQKIKQLIDEGEIGQVVSIQAMESVLYWHYAHSFVRGNWANSETTTPMILQKCCHDLDLLLWLSGKQCVRVSSFGALTLFDEAHAPKGSALRCVECEVREACPYDAEKIYITNKRTGVAKGNTQWPCDVLDLNPTVESIQKAIETGPYGRCVFHCDNNVVDHQVVAMELENQVTADLTMSAFTTGSRSIDVMGTTGEIKGNFDKNYIKLIRFGEEPEVMDTKKDLGVFHMEYDPYGHGGGDKRLIRDLINLINGSNTDNSSLTTLERSLESHYVAIAAEESRLENGQPVMLSDLIARSSRDV